MGLRPACVAKGEDERSERVETRTDHDARHRSRARSIRNLW